MSIDKLIKECVARNFSKVEKLFESELEQKVFEILNNDKEELLDLKELDDSDEEVKAESDESDEEVKTESEEVEDEVKTESEEKEDELKTESDDNDADDEVKTESEEVDSDDEVKAESDAFDATLKDGEHLEESEEEEEKPVTEEDDKVELDYVTEDDFEKIAESVIFGKRK